MPLAEINAPEPILRTLLAGDWDLLPPAVHGMHPLDTCFEGEGRMRIRHGKSRAARVLARIIGFPPEQNSCPTVLRVLRDSEGEDWIREFGGRLLASRQYLDHRGILNEQFGRLVIGFQISGDRKGIHYKSIGGAILVGRSRIPLPPTLVPRIEALESESEIPARCRICVRLTSSIFGFIGSYEGEMRAVEAAR